MKRLLVSGLAALICAAPLSGLAADAYKAPRNGFGQPDLGGNWSNATLTPQARSPLYGTRKILTPEEVAILEGADADKAAAFDQFAAQGSAEAARFGSYDNPESRGVGERCIVGFGRNAGPPMFPNGWYNNNYLIVQGSAEVAIEVEMVHDVRHIALNAKHRTDDVRPWFGDSIGWYEGDTLVVETNHFPQAQAYNGAWKDLTVTERFTRVARDRIRYRFTVSDPTVWDHPWGGEYEMHPLKGQVFEYACHEGNYALPGILAGARAEERKAAAAAATKAETVALK